MLFTSLVIIWLYGPFPRKAIVTFNLEYRTLFQYKSLKLSVNPNIADQYLNISIANVGLNLSQIVSYEIREALR